MRSLAAPPPLLLMMALLGCASTAFAQDTGLTALSVSDASVWISNDNQHLVSLLFVHTSYDGKAKIALPHVAKLASLFHSYKIASVDVTDDSSFQQKLHLSSLPALVVRIGVIASEHSSSTPLQEPVTEIFYGPWDSDSEIIGFVKRVAPRVCAVIPGRFGSTRFRNKLTRTIRGKPMIQNTFERVSEASLVDAVWVATESDELVSLARNFTNRVLKTSDEPINGMERIGEAESQLPASCSVLVNVHGDEPFVDPDHVNEVVRLFESIMSGSDQRRKERLGAASLRRRIKTEEEALNRGIIKMALRDDSTAQYLSRALIPHSKDGKFDPNFHYWSHINLHAFARGFASKYRATPSTPAQLREDVEYLRILIMGYDIVTSEIFESERDVNTEEDYNYLVAKYGA